MRMDDESGIGESEEEGIAKDIVSVIPEMIDGRRMTVDYKSTYQTPLHRLFSQIRMRASLCRDQDRL